MKSVTMKDIAQAMNTSIVSVSKALAGKSGVSEELREKIILKAQEMGYMYASIPTGNVKVQGNIGILVADRFFNDSSFYSSMYRALLLECNDVGVSCLLEIVSAQNEASCNLPNLISGQKCEGIIFMGEMSPEYIKMVAQSDIPYILLDFYRDASNDDSVISDGVSGAFQLTSYLVSLGYKSIGYVGTLLATSSILDRYLGYHKAILTHGLSMRQDWILPDRDEDGHFIDIQLPEEIPSAFVCNCDETAYLLMGKLKDFGYDIPQDVAILGFDDFRFATLADPPLTTYKVNVPTMGKVTVNRIIRKMAKAPYTKGCSIISGEMVLRASTPANPIIS